METSNLAEVCLQFLGVYSENLYSNAIDQFTDLDYFKITLDLVQRGKWMNRAEFGPGKWDHTTSAVELHSTTTEGNHGVDKREILGLQVVNVS